MESRTPGRIDWPSAAMALVASVALVWAGWLRFGPEGPAEPLAVGAQSPPLRLLDPDTTEPLLLLGLQGRVVWVTFWTAGSAGDLAALEQVWNRLRNRRRFSMVAAAVGEPAKPRRPAAGERSEASLPVYLATPETCRAFGVAGRNLPLHLLIDERGKVGAVAWGSSEATLSRLSAQAEGWLDVIDPAGDTRFAMSRTLRSW
jgi:hypothetical protein